MNNKQSRLAAISDRARLARLTRSELERLLVRAKRAFEAFGTSAGRPEDSDGDDDASRFGSSATGRPAPAAV
jgi:hypothetical protein